eukprot:gene7152-468_t
MTSPTLPLAKDVRATATSSTSIHVTWSAPPIDITTGLVKFSFRILRRRKGAGTFVVAHQASDTYYEHEINGLRPYQDYELAVQTYPTGFSHAPSITAKELPTTEPILCRTMEATPSRPRSFRVIEATTESVTIAWNPPRQLNGILRGYKLYFDKAEETVFNVAEVPPESTNYTAKHLFPASTYRFQIIAFTNAGEGPMSKIIHQRTRDSALDRFKQQGSHNLDFTLACASSNDEESNDDDNDADFQVENSQHGNLHLLHKNQSCPANKQGKPNSGLKLLAVPASEPKESSQSNLPSMDTKESPHHFPAPRRKLLNEDDWRAMFFSPAPKTKMSTIDKSVSSQRDSTDSSKQFEIKVTKNPQRCTFTVLPLTETNNKDLSESDRLPPMVSRTNINAPPRKQHSKAAGFLTRASSSQSSSSRDSPIDLGVRIVSRGISSPSQTPSTDSAVTPVEDTSNIETSARRKHRKDTGTIRGKKHGIRNLLDQLENLSTATPSSELTRMLEEESKKKRAVLYITSTTAIRETFQACEEVKAIFYNLRVRVELRNIALDRKCIVVPTSFQLFCATSCVSPWASRHQFDLVFVYLSSRNLCFRHATLPSLLARNELSIRLPDSTVPQVFLEGRHIGDGSKIKELNESGLLRQLLSGCEQRPNMDCLTCASNNGTDTGSKRSIRHGFAHLTSESSLKCTLCNENALQRCPVC